MAFVGTIFGLSRPNNSWLPVFIWKKCLKNAWTTIQPTILYGTLGMSQLDIYLVYIVHTRRFHTKKMLTKMGLRATIQLLDAICQPHVRKALVKGTTRKYFCLFVWRHLKFIFLVAFACCWLSAAAAWLWICREVLRSGNLSPLKKNLSV